MIVVLMGPAGCGKTAVGAALAAKRGWLFHDADDDHPPANVAKMRAGIPLAAADREPWIAAVAARARGWRDAGVDAVIACSALTRALRARLDAEGVRLIYLKAPRAELARRLAARHGHFMPAALLDSQLAALEEPAAGVVDAARPLGVVVAAVEARLAWAAESG